MSKHAMLILVINMGGEMVYIIDQRLKAQSIPSEKSARVLEDVIATMFNPTFIDEMLKPHDVYKVDVLPTIFRRLAHSSIMRLNEPSMDKLYDLMTMGFKYQLLSTTTPKGVLIITQNHLHSLIDLLPSGSQSSLAISLLKRTQQLVSKLFNNIWDWEMASLRYTLCGALQDRRVKVSLLLQGNLQDSSGAILVSSERRDSQPDSSDQLGTVKYYAHDLLQKTDQVIMPGRQDQAMKNDVRVGASNLIATSIQPTLLPLGKNIYEIDPSAAAVPASADQPNPSQSIKHTDQIVESSKELSRNGVSVSEPSAHLDALADFLQVRSLSDSTFKLDLDLSVEEESKAKSLSNGIQSIVIQAKANSTVSDWKVEDNTTTDDDGGSLDLLAMMDSLDTDPEQT